MPIVCLIRNNSRAETADENLNILQYNSFVRLNGSDDFTGEFFAFFQIFDEKRKIWPVRIGIESERGNKPTSRCMRGGENS